MEGRIAPRTEEDGLAAALEEEEVVELLEDGQGRLWGAAKIVVAKGSRGAGW